MPQPPPPSQRPGGHIDFLDRIRGIAILLVVVFHALGAGYGLDQLHWRRFLRDFADTPPFFLPMTPFTFGWLGVAIFFALSGFCIHLSHEKTTAKSFKAFFLRRFFRIYPAYLVALCFFAFLYPMATLRNDCIASAEQFWSHALMVSNVTADLHYGINPSFWSIVVEVQLYLIYPLLLWIVRRFGWGTALWGCGILEISLRIIQSVHYQPHWIIGSPFYYWFSWAIGAKLADDYLKARPLFLTGCPLWLWPVLTIGSNLFRPLSTMTFVFGALATTKFISHWLLRTASTPSHSGKWGRFVSRIGVISYSLYLLNQPLLNSFVYYLNRTVEPLQLPPFLLFSSALVVGGTLLILASELFYRWVELPSIELGKWACKKLLPARQELSTALKTDSAGV